MSDYVGGCILFQPEQTREALIAATMQAMNLVAGAFSVQLPDEDGFPHNSDEGYPVWEKPTLEQSLAALTQVDCGIIKAQGPDQGETLWFDAKVGPYPVMIIWVNGSAMYYDKWPEYSEALVERWLQLCEQGHAIFGYFSPYEDMFEREYLEERILPALQHEDIAQLLKANDACWLVYLGPEVAKRWRHEQPPLPFSLLVSQELPSGAHFFRTRTQVFKG